MVVVKVRSLEHSLIIPALPAQMAVLQILFLV
jgi:hypothetical protein